MNDLIQLDDSIRRDVDGVGIFRFFILDIGILAKVYEHVNKLKIGEERLTVGTHLLNTHPSALLIWGMEYLLLQSYEFSWVNLAVLDKFSDLY